jgi:inner membrane protein
MEFKNPFGPSAQITLRGLWIGFIVLVLMIPTFQVNDLVRERQQRQIEAGTEISRLWSSAQTITGPFIVIPYLQLSADQKNYERKNGYVLPDVLKINTNITPEIRHRSIYDVAVYSSEIELSGSFDHVSIEKLNIDSTKIFWKEISVQTGITDFRGIADPIFIEWNGKAHAMEGGVVANSVIEKGVQAPIKWPEVLSKNTFKLTLRLKGSEQISFVPLGKSTEAKVKSNWKDPSFGGAFLPSVPAVINEDGFEAQWKILELNRNYPQLFKDATFPIAESAFSITFKQLSDLYSKTERSVKYAFLFIALTFAMYFFMELVLKSKVHSIQYVMVGFALCLFYLLLLSISEYLGFDKAYLISTIAIVSMVGLYTSHLFKQKKSAFAFTSIIVLLYSFIYLLIQLQEKALLIGSISLFILLGIVMYFTRNLDWGSKDSIE